MFIDVVPNGRSASAVLLRESYREGSKVRKRTLANLGKLPPAVVDRLRVLLQGGTVVARPEEVFEIQRSLPHGHVAAVIGMMRKLDLPRLLGRSISRERDLALALIASRIIAPGSKLATARGLSPETASSSLWRVLDLGVIEEREIYAALDWLGGQQDRIERVRPALRRRWPPDRRRGVRGRCRGSAQITKLKRRFGLKHVVLVGDRGMITSARIREDLQPAGLDWITSLRAPQIQALAQAGRYNSRCSTSAISRRSLSRRAAHRLPQSRPGEGTRTPAEPLFSGQDGPVRDRPSWSRLNFSRRSLPFMRRYVKAEICSIRGSVQAAEPTLARRRALGPFPDGCRSAFWATHPARPLKRDQSIAITAGDHQQAGAPPDRTTRASAVDSTGQRLCGPGDWVVVSGMAPGRVGCGGSCISPQTPTLARSSLPS